LKRFVHLLSTVVRRRPVFVLVAAIALTFVFGFFIQYQESSEGNEGFAPDSAEFLANETVQEVFPESSVPFQIVFSGDSGDLLTAEGLVAYLDSVDAIYASRATELMADNGDPIIGFFDPIIDELGRRGIDPRLATDGEVKDAYLALEGDDAELATTFLSIRTDEQAAVSPTGAMIVLLQALEDDPDMTLLQAIEVDIAEHVRAVSGGSITIEPFSFALLFEDQEAFVDEIGRLFAAAGFIILIILASVFLLVPNRRRSVPVIAGGFALMGAITALMVFEVVPIPAPLLAIGLVFIAWSVFHRKLRRSVADTLVAIVVIFMSIGWMNGIGVLLGPGYLGVIGPFNEMLQIIPILLIGLGVDYSIHLTSRYREELAAGKDVVEAAVTASSTVGVALVLATVTTAVGFLTNLISPVSAIADFGVVATVGIGAAFILMVTFVPSLRILLDRRAERRGIHPIDEDHQSDSRLLLRLMGSLSLLARKYAVSTLVVAVALFGLGVLGFTKLETTFSFTDFVPQDAPLLETFELLDEEFEGGFENSNVLIEGEVASPDVHNAVVDSFMTLRFTPDVRQRGGFPWADSPMTALYILSAPPEAGGSAAIYSPEFVAEAATLGWEPDFTLLTALGGGGEVDLAAITEAVDQFKVEEGVDVAALYDAAASYDPDLMGQVVAKGDDGAYQYLNVDIRTNAGEAGARELRENLESAFSGVAAIEGVTAIPTNQNIISAGVVDALRTSNVSSLILTLLAAGILLVMNFWFTTSA